MILYDGKFFWLMVFIMTVRVLFLITQNIDMEKTDEIMMIAGGPANLETDNGMMTPTYMPPPEEAGDGLGSKPKGDTK